MHICSFLIPQAKTTELVQPREGTFYDPAPTSQTAAVFRIAHCEQRRDVTCTKSTADFLCVVGPIFQYAIGATARPTTQALQRRNGIEQRQRLGRVVAIRAGQFDCQWNATPVTDQMALAAPFSSIGRIRPSLRPPKTARTEQLSTTAWDQSIWPSRESQFSNTK